MNVVSYIIEKVWNRFWAIDTVLPQSSSLIWRCTCPWLMRFPGRFRFGWDSFRVVSWRIRSRGGQSSGVRWIRRLVFPSSWQPMIPTCMCRSRRSDPWLVVVCWCAPYHREPHQLVGMLNHPTIERPYSHCTRWPVQDFGSHARCSESVVTPYWTVSGQNPRGQNTLRTKHSE